MSLVLRPYQAELLDRVIAALNAGTRTAVMQLGTGGGKTATASALLARASSRGIASIFLAHLDSLISDTAARLRADGIRCGFVQADRPTDPEALVQVASMATLHVRGQRPPAGLIIVDECHRAMTESVRGILDAYPEAWILGLTATPQRADGKALGNIFEALFCGPSNRWLTEHGYLVPCDIVGPREFIERGRCEDPVDAYEREAPGTRAIVFESTVAEAEALAARYTARGWPAGVIIGETPRAEREALVAAVWRGDIKVLVGVGVFIEGFDLPAIETVVLARAFTVTGSFLQAIGRGLRPSPTTGKQRCLVLDLCGSTWLHGLPIEDRIWSIDGKAVRRAEATIPLRRCTKCLAIFKTARKCPRCGAAGEAIERKKVPLNRAEKMEQLSALPPEERDRRYLARLIRVATERLRLDERRASRWALQRFRKQFGREPVEGAIT